MDSKSNPYGFLNSPWLGQAAALHSYFQLDTEEQQKRLYAIPGLGNYALQLSKTGNEVFKTEDGGNPEQWNGHFDVAVKVASDKMDLGNGGTGQATRDTDKKGANDVGDYKKTTTKIRLRKKISRGKKPASKQQVVMVIAE